MQKPEQTIRLRGSARTNTGKVRDNNEDNVHFWTSKDYIALAVVADGMGGAVAGEEASRIAIESIQEGLTHKEPDTFYETLSAEHLTDNLKHVIREANLNIVDLASAQPELKGMGTTVTLAFIRDSQVVIGHVGDSRAYLVDGADGHIEQITSDHSFVQALVAAGHITEEEAEDHPMKNVLYRALGQARDVEVDVYYHQLHPGDRLVLCSDGLTLHVKPHEIAEMALAEDEPSESSQNLIDLANERGGRDNVSVIVVKAEILTELTRASETEAGQEGEFAEDDDSVTRPFVIKDAPTGYGSSESANMSQAEHPDTAVSSYKALDSGKDPRSTQEIVSANVFMVKQQRLQRERLATRQMDAQYLGEGRDLSTPDQ